ncbi:hypothetical protein O9992_01535 [Vibrio lentus]|nr:hypothetical protein [Vibrio lentus]
MNIMQYCLDSQQKVTKAIYDSKTAMAFFYDEDWADGRMKMQANI